MIFLIGARASGKSTLASRLASFAGRSCLDMDKALETRLGGSIENYVDRNGWEAFRTEESRLLAHVARFYPAGCVVATGGGVPLSEDNRALMRARGLVVYLEADADLLEGRRRLSPFSARRPPLFSGSDLRREIETTLLQRAPLYKEAAHIIIDASMSVEAVVLKITNSLASFSC